jgi:2-polyprenyl-3-methyl-5-hydroxy-6-metoxy-1,4-benzoquinol methylase
MVMNLNPTLRCACDKSYCQSIVSYERPPQGEVKIDLRQNKYQREYVSCSVCQHLYSKHDIDLSCLYKQEYVDATYGGKDGMLTRLNKVLSLPNGCSDNAKRVQRIENYLKQFLSTKDLDFPRTVLDVGAGIGVFPAVMKRYGWSVSAVEPDIRTADHLREEVGITAFSEDFLKLDKNKLGKFSLITFNKVLEHLEDPISLLSHAKKFLADNGICYLEVPDIAASTESYLREEFFIEHHHIFSIESCAAMAERAGFRVLRIERLVEPSGKFTIFAFLQ